MDGDLDPRGYLSEIERFWLLLRQRGLMLSARDVRIVETWREEGVPARVVCQALLEGAERFRQVHGRDEPLPSSLRYFEAVVAEVAGRWRERSSVRVEGAASERSGGEGPEALAGLLVPLVAAGRAEQEPRVQKVYRHAYRRLARLWRRLVDGTGGTDEVLPALVETDRRLVDELVDQLDEEERRALDAEVDAAMRGDEDRLGEQGRADHRRVLLEEAMTRRWHLLRLAPRAGGGPRFAGMGWVEPEERA